ncbi:hypothetical protein NDU88_012549 [Pleurodeles waltl]|uniref:Uncharacterized protein n=1 Tax=Pleurodeles waltl TaxID=8319 RepID=A0AAV7R0D6_PLEWA|nr:hypothetical protein NDU88_012549 [Pleurodeles waltl]
MLLVASGAALTLMRADCRRAHGEQRAGPEPRRRLQHEGGRVTLSRRGRPGGGLKQAARPALHPTRIGAYGGLPAHPTSATEGRATFAKAALIIKQTRHGCKRPCECSQAPVTSDNRNFC